MWQSWRLLEIQWRYKQTNLNFDMFKMWVAFFNMGYERIFITILLAKISLMWHIGKALMTTHCVVTQSSVGQNVPVWYLVDGTICCEHNYSPLWIMDRLLQANTFCVLPLIILIVSTQYRYSFCSCCHKRFDVMNFIPNYFTIEEGAFRRCYHYFFTW